MIKTVIIGIIGSLLIVNGTAMAAADDWPLFGARPIIAYALFPDSDLHGPGADVNRISTKKEDVVGGIAAAFSLSWRQWRSELEYAWRARTDANGYVYDGDLRRIGIRNDLQNQSVTLNLRRYFGSRDGVAPYVAAGYGLVRHESVAEYLDIVERRTLEAATREESVPTWNIGAGFEFETSRGWIIDLGYRYVDLGQASSPEFGAGLNFSTGPLISHDLFIAIARTR